MASANIIKIDGMEYIRVTDTSLGHRLQYAAKIDKYTKKQWIAAHNEVMQSIEPHKKQALTNKEMKKIVMSWLDAPKESRTNAKLTGININRIEAQAEMSIKNIVGSYLSEFCLPEINSQAAMAKAKRQCGILLDFFKKHGISNYIQLKRDIVKTYPEWRDK